MITAAGMWTCALVLWRIFDKQSVSVRGPGAAVSGVEWGIFVALAVAAFLVYTGSRIRAAHEPEPELPDGSVVGGDPGPPAAPGPGRAASAAAASPSPSPSPAPAAPVAASPAAPSEARTRGWLSAPPKQRKKPPSEQLTIPLDDQ